MLYQEASAALREHYRATRERDLAEAEWRLTHLDRFFTGRKLASIGPADATAYAATRQEQEAANAIINRELAVLGWMLPWPTSTARWPGCRSSAS